MIDEAHHEDAADGEVRSSELTAIQLVRQARQQGLLVEDEDARSAGGGFAAALLDTPASPPPVPVPAPPPRRRKLVESASAPVMGAVDSRTGDGDRLEHTKLPRIQSSRALQPQVPRASMKQEELGSLPIAEALRQVLIEQVGSLKQAYKAMDINGGGVVNRVEFEKGLLRAKIFGSPLVGYRTASDLFRGIDKSQQGSLSLQEFLGYIPFKKGREKGRERDTHAQWMNYNNKTSAQKSRMARKPRWHSPNILLPDPEPDHIRKRKELRGILRDARTRGNVSKEEKLRLVKGLVSDEDRDEDRLHEFRKMSEMSVRISDSIHSCSRARSELKALQQAMTQLSPIVSPSVVRECKISQLREGFPGLGLHKQSLRANTLTDLE